MARHRITVAFYDHSKVDTPIIDYLFGVQRTNHERQDLARMLMRLGMSAFLSGKMEPNINETDVSIHNKVATDNQIVTTAPNKPQK
ncbi:MAG: hypothetical protein CUN55_21295, partial [Phototrophicales bacterium]